MEEKRGSLTINYHEKGDLLEESVGKILGFLTQLLPSSSAGFLIDQKELRNALDHWADGNMEKIWQHITPDTAADLARRFAGVEWKGNVEVNLNNNDVIGQLKRLFSSDRSLSLLSRAAIGLPATLLFGAMGKLTNWNYYNPYTETVQVYNPNKYIVAGKMQIAENIDQTANPISREFKAFSSIFPFLLNTFTNGYANTMAVQKFEGEEYRKAMKYLNSNSAAEASLDALMLLGLLTGLQEFDDALPIDMPEIGMAENVAIAGSMALLFNVGTQVYTGELDLSNPSMYFDKGKSMFRKKKDESIPPQVQLNMIAG